MNNLNLILVGVVAVALVVFSSLCLYTVDQREQALVFEFGRVVTEPITEPGLKFKLPYQNVEKFDKRLLVHDNVPVTVDVSENERLIVDAFARYRIVNALQFYETVRTPTIAKERLQVFLDSSIREVVGGQGLRAVISGERRLVMEQIRDLVQDASDDAELGIDVVDVRIKRADLPQQNSEDVFDRMRTERQQEAQLFRAEGEERKREIESEADRRVTVLLAKAERRAQEIRAEGDAYRNAIFACAYGADPEFFSFYRTMEAYERSFQTTDTTMVLSPDSEFFKFFGDASGSSGSGIEGLDSKTSRSLRSSDPNCGPDGEYDYQGISFLDPEAVEEVLEESLEQTLPTEGSALPSLEGGDQQSSLSPEPSPTEVPATELTEEDGSVVVPPPAEGAPTPADEIQN